MRLARFVLAAAPLVVLASVSRAAEPAQAPEIGAIRRALAAQPLDCEAIRGAFDSLTRAGRRDGDVSVIAEARRLGAPCAIEAANAAAEALPVPDPEILSWLLHHPEARGTSPSLDMAPGSAPAVPGDGTLEVGIPLDCGLLLVARRIEHGTPVSRVVLTFRNRTTRSVDGHDIVVTVNGQTWRSIVLPRGEAPPDAPLGAADHLRWDGDSASWVDRRQTESRSISFPAKKEFRPLAAPIPPGTTFDIIVRVEGLAADARSADLDIRFESCKLN